EEFVEARGIGGTELDLLRGGQSGNEEQGDNGPAASPTPQFAGREACATKSEHSDYFFCGVRSLATGLTLMPSRTTSLGLTMRRSPSLRPDRTSMRSPKSRPS